MYKIATWNVNSLKIRLPQVLTWIAQNEPDIMAIQEIKLQDAAFPLAAFTEIGYQAIYSGQKTYNGVAILSKHGAQDIVTDIPNLADQQRRILMATINGVRIVNLYVPNGESVTSEKYLYKLNWLREITAYLKEEISKHEKMIILGDFNIAPEARDVHDPKAWEGQVLFSEPERQALHELKEGYFQDTFRLFEQAEKSFTWWDYRALGFQLNRGLRIDYILANPVMAKLCISCSIDRNQRKAERPSDHAPVLATFNLS
jgi:exodeoxyribonuclease-3